MNYTWSYSSISLFQQCPRKYHRLRVVKDIVEPPQEHLLYGSAVHKAAEEYVRDDTPIPKKYAYIQPFLDPLKALSGEKYCEYEMGLTKDMQPCGFRDKDVWFRGIADLLVINGDKARIVDYKTSKNARYADVKQLDLVAAGLFAKFPQVKKVKSALVFVVSKEFVKAEHHAEKMQEYVASPARDVARIEAALENGVWNPVQGPLCRFCPVRECEYNEG